MSLRDCELDIAKLLEASGLGSLADGQPDLFAGPYPSSAPDALISCRHSGAEKPEKYLANTGLALHRETVTVLVRGTREPGSYAESGARARAAWSVLYDLHPDEYVLVDPDSGAPTYLGEDSESRPQWSFTVALEYLTATAPGVVVPLSRDATLRVGGLNVTGDVQVGRCLVLSALPFSSFPSPTGARGALLYDTDSSRLHVSTGTAWVAVGAPSAAAAVPFESTARISADNVQEALEEVDADVAAGAAALAAHVAANAAHGVAGELVGTTDAQVLSNKKHSGRLEVTGVQSGQVAFAIPVGAWVKLGTSATNNDVLYTDGTVVYLGANGSGTFVATTVRVGGDLVLQGRVLRSSSTGGLTYSATADGTGAGTVAHRFTTTNAMSGLAGVLIEAAQPTAPGVYARKWAVDKDGKPLLVTGDSSATPGNAAVNAPAGKSAVAAGSASVTVANSLCTAASLVRAWVQQASEDTSGSHVVRTSAALGALSIYVYPPPAAPLAVAWEITN